jgi:hypothetical protein
LLCSKACLIASLRSGSGICAARSVLSTHNLALEPCCQTVYIEEMSAIASEGGYSTVWSCMLKRIAP